MIPVAQLTGTALVTEALEELGAMTAGDTLDATDGAKGLAVLNRLIDTSNIGRGNIMTERIDTWTLAIGQQTYTIGADPAGILTPSFAADRPVRISRANLFLPGGSTPVRRKINLLDKEQWSRKAVQNIAGIPIDLYCDYAYPLSTYYFYMVPDQAYQFETYSWRQFQPLSTLAGVIAIPPGYYEFWLYSLVMRLAGPFGKTPNETTIQLWKDAKAEVMALNARSPRIRGDADLCDDGAGLYNWLSGEAEVE